ncbi:hypothetical protein CALVIDRAFT_437058 [Calocera viscosa TUFC12733]|uniref:Uncharacterized protein n=1 Tax=Calocera viscosa (strain TUFC12733) TaxID=1330018 RepID=A0A167FTV5_CALVF|nr:hypothetical protein CALVIDRAFT_437058 [Calocera viscosa TUFC12733]
MNAGDRRREGMHAFVPGTDSGQSASTCHQGSACYPLSGRWRRPGRQERAEGGEARERSSTSCNGSTAKHTRARTLEHAESPAATMCWTPTRAMPTAKRVALRPKGAAEGGAYLQVRRETVVRSRPRRQPAICCTLPLRTPCYPRDSGMGKSCEPSVFARGQVYIRAHGCTAT